MALISQASRRYAEAAVESALTSGESALEALTNELGALAGALSMNADLENVLMNPSFSTEERTKVIDAVLGHINAGNTTRRTVKLLSDKGRLADLGEIAEAVKNIADERAGRTVAYVETASELSDAAKEQLRRALEKRTGKKLEMEITIDPSLIGGVRARVGSFLLDGTIQTELARLRERLAGV